jgi:phosphatidylglycerophosphate synthase
LYGNSYKGITDLVTKWLWPLPARLLVMFCAKSGVSPNMVTTAGLILVVAASFLFLSGHYAAGLACGWVMTFLDTVDGKLARVTVRSSRLGHVLDHGIDIVHPPFWYVMWGMGLISFAPLLEIGRVEFYWIITAGYIAGRVIEGLFHALGNCSLFAWRPLDAYFRLVTARRNPCLIILTATYAVGRPDWGLVGVGLWTAISSMLMLVRLLHAWIVRTRTGPLESWLKDPEVAKITHPNAYRSFSGTRGAYG